jgi:branched-chain amino acid transport system substrate-binding protein
VFISVGYSGDNIQLVRQEGSLGVKPKLTIVVTAGDKRSDYGDFGDNVAVIAEWAPEERVPGNAEFVKKVMADTGMTSIAPPFLQGFTGLNTLLTSVTAAKSADPAAVLQAMDSGVFDTPYGKLSYRPSKGGAKHQLLTDENMVLIQFRAQGEDVVLPVDKASGKLVYPVGPA